MTQIRTSVALVALLAVAITSYVAHKAHWENAAVTSVQVAIDEYVAGGKPSNLQLRTDDFGLSKPLDTSQFLKDLREGFELFPQRELATERNFHFVVVRAANGTTYVATTKYTEWEGIDGVQIVPEWVIVCCYANE